MTVKDTLDILTYKNECEIEKKYEKKIFDYVLEQYNKIKIKKKDLKESGEDFDTLKKDYIASLIFLAFNLEAFLLGIHERKGKATNKK